MSVAKLNVHILTLRIQDKSNDIECNHLTTLQEEGGMPMQRCVGKSQKCVKRGYVDAKIDVSKDVVRKVLA